MTPAVYDGTWMQLRRTIPFGLLLAAIPLVAAQAPDQLPDVDRFGPQVGEAVPDFELVDQTGRARTLASILGPNGALLVFSRSAVW